MTRGFVATSFNRTNSGNTKIDHYDQIGRKEGLRGNNLLESMIVASTPTRAEVNDIYSTLRDGADGLVLAAETAIGSFPIECAAMIVKMISNLDSRDVDDPMDFTRESFSLLVDPHGGQLVRKNSSKGSKGRVADMPIIYANETDLLDCEQLSNGTYSPLDGFMDSETCESVLDTIDFQMVLFGRCRFCFHSVLGKALSLGLGMKLLSPMILAKFVSPLLCQRFSP